MLAAAGSAWWVRPWRLSTAVIRSWRAHREGLRLMVAHEDEGSLVTAGRGLIDGKECEVLRCWRLSDTSAGAKAEHGMVIAGACFSPATYCTYKMLKLQMFPEHLKITRAEYVQSHRKHPGALNSCLWP